MLRSQSLLWISVLVLVGLLFIQQQAKCQDAEIDLAEIQEPRCAMTLKKGIDFGACGEILRFYYNRFLNRCEWNYGCVNDAGGNNFGTLEECEESCLKTLPKKIRPTSVGCLRRLVPDLDFGECAGQLSKRYHYSTSIGRCKEFIGCSNSTSTNNFETLQECKKACTTRNSTTTTSAIGILILAKKLRPHPGNQRFIMDADTGSTATSATSTISARAAAQPVISNFFLIYAGTNMVLPNPTIIAAIASAAMLYRLAP